MRNGFTTGSCAAAAAAAAAYMLFENKKIDTVDIITPSGDVFSPKLWDVKLSAKDPACASCAVRKDAGDDPDITDKMLIYATVSLTDDESDSVIIEGGVGIGTVTRPGLDRPVGDAAINTVPRRMIEQEIRRIAEDHGYNGAVKVVISAPEGEKIAAKTFNPKLGIEGGISIIGTSGIVEPMSTRALIDTIKVQLRQQRAMGEKTAFVSPGNYGLDFMKKLGYDLDKAVKCSNFIGETIDMARDAGFERMLLVGHVGKLIKLSGGIMNTHSKEADCRMELMAAAAIRCGASADVANRILECISTDDAYAHMIEAGIEKECFGYIMGRIDHYLSERSGDMKIECIVFSEKYGLLGSTSSQDRRKN